jgi:hypothetical protein
VLTFLLGAFSIRTWSREVRVESRLGRTVASLNYVAEAVGATPLLFGDTVEILDKAVNEKGKLSFLNFIKFVSAYAKSRLYGNLWRQYGVNLLVKALPENVLRYKWQFHSFRYQLHDPGNSVYPGYCFPIVLNRRKNPENLNLIWVRLKRREFAYVDKHPSAFAVSRRHYLKVNYGYREQQNQSLQATDNDQPSCIFDEFPFYSYFLISTVFLGLAFLGILLLLNLHFFNKPLYRFTFGGLLTLLGHCGLLSVSGAISLDDPFFWLPLCRSYDPYSDGECGHGPTSHGAISVTHKYPLTSPTYCNTVIAIGRVAIASVLYAFSKKLENFEAAVAFVFRLLQFGKAPQYSALHPGDGSGN